MSEHNKDEENIEVHSCMRCESINFNMIVGGGLMCGDCGAAVLAYWINEDGIVTQENMLCQ